MKYEQNITIDKAFLKNVKNIYFVFENCEDFDIPIDKITDIYFGRVYARK
jgi:hypothetical protein